MTWEQDMRFKLYAHPNTPDISQNVFRAVGRHEGNVVH